MHGVLTGMIDHARMAAVQQTEMMDGIGQVARIGGGGANQRRGVIMRRRAVRRDEARQRRPSAIALLMLHRAARHRHRLNSSRCIAPYWNQAVRRQGKEGVYTAVVSDRVKMMNDAPSMP